MSLIERRNVYITEPLFSVITTDLDRIVVDSEPLVRVTDREVEIEIVVYLDVVV